jgi:hypothetical protein
MELFDWRSCESLVNETLVDLANVLSISDPPFILSDLVLYLQFDCFCYPAWTSICLSEFRIGTEAPDRRL